MASPAKLCRLIAQIGTRPSAAHCGDTRLPAPPPLLESLLQLTHRLRHQVKRGIKEGLVVASLETHRGMLALAPWSESQVRQSLCQVIHVEANHVPVVLERWKGETALSIRPPEIEHGDGMAAGRDGEYNA